MYKLLFGLLLAASFVACGGPATETAEDGTTADTTAAGAPTESKQVEFADMKYVDMGKTHLGHFRSGDVDAWLTAYADNARYYWSGGDSLVGKEAITNYWKDRRGNVIESITFTNEIWLPVTVNNPQANETPGTYLLSWYQATAKYKATGKSATFWAHSVHHFDANDKIDQTIMYFDRVPIVAASTK
jgi:hypothetical protein